MKRCFVPSMSRTSLEESGGSIPVYDFTYGARSTFGSSAKLAADVRQGQFERILSTPLLAPGEVWQVQFERCMMTDVHHGIANSPDILFTGLIEPPGPSQNAR